MAASTALGSHTSMRWMDSRRYTGMRSAASMPMPWPTGAPVSVPALSLAFGGCTDPSWRISNPIVRWVWMTPLGSDVVPDVYATSAGTGGCAATGPYVGSDGVG